jgi:hypothetical protein
MVDLQVLFGILPVVSIYVRLSRVKKVEHVAVLPSYAVKVQPSLADAPELKRLDELERKTTRMCSVQFF